MSQPNAGLGLMPGIHLHIFQMPITDSLILQCQQMTTLMEELYDTKDVKELKSVENLLEGLAEDVDFYKKLVEGKLIIARRTRTTPA